MALGLGLALVVGWWWQGDHALPDWASLATPQRDDAGSHELGSASGERSAAQPLGATTAGTDQAAGVESTHVALVPRAPSELDDPAADGWTSEVVGDAAARQLKRLTKLFALPPDQWETDLVPWVSGDCAAGRLRPADLVVAYESPGVRVFRPRGPAGTTEGVVVAEAAVSAVGTGPAGLAAALGELVAPWAGWGPIRAEFKTFQVELDEGRARTATYVDLLVAGPRGSRQIHATWRCDWELGSPAEPPRLAGVLLEEFEEAEYAGSGAHPWADITADLLGQDAAFRQQLQRGVLSWAEQLPTALGQDIFEQQGLAIGDANGDGRDDVYICQPGGLPNRLYLHQPDGSVREAAAEAGLDVLDFTRGALWVDFDNDGDQDLALTLANGLVIHENDGAGRFRPVFEFATLGRPNGLAAADYDRDGRLDLYLACYGSGYAGFSGSWFPLPYFDAQNGAPNHLLHNEGNWHFQDATRTAGLDVNNQRWSYAAAWEDYDRDGDPDLYVANDFGRNNLFRNDGGFFVEVARDAGVEDVANGMSVSWGDYNRDGWEDLYVGNMWSSAGNRITYQRRFQPDLPEAERGRYQRLARGNSLFASDGAGGFHDESLRARATLGRWAWSSLFVDVNNDSWLDLLVGNGFLTNVEPHDL